MKRKKMLLVWFVILVVLGAIVGCKEVPSDKWEYFKKTVALQARKEVNLREITMGETEEYISVLILCGGSNGVQSTSITRPDGSHFEEVFWAVSAEVCPMIREGTTYIIINIRSAFEIYPDCDRCTSNDKKTILDDGYGIVGTLKIDEEEDNILFKYKP